MGKHISKRALLPTYEGHDYYYGDARHKRWRLTCLARDEYLCQNCGKTAVHVHHKKEVDAFPELRYDIDNGVSLCVSCHFLQHKDRQKYLTENVAKLSYGTPKFTWRNRWTGKKGDSGHLG